MAGANAPAAAGPISRRSAPGEACEEQGSVRVCVAEFRVNGPVVQLNLSVENVGDAAIAVAAVGPVPSLIDHDGARFELQQMSGLPICGGTFKDGTMSPGYQGYCLAANSSVLRRSTFRGLPPGGRAGLSLQFRAEQPSEGNAFTLTGAIASLPRLPASMASAEAEKMEARPLIFMLSNIRP